MKGYATPLIKLVISRGMSYCSPNWNNKVHCHMCYMIILWQEWNTGFNFNIKMISSQYRNFHYNIRKSHSYLTWWWEFLFPKSGICVETGPWFYSLTDDTYMNQGNQGCCHLACGKMNWCNKTESDSFYGGQTWHNSLATPTLIHINAETIINSLLVCRDI